MNARARTLIAAALVLGIASGPTVAHAAPASASASASASATAGVAAAPVFTAPPDAVALRKALAGVGARSGEATAALVRVGGTSGGWRGSAGVADLRTGRGPIEDARFRAGSVTKTFTAAVVLQLAAEGRVDLDRPVQRYLPGLLPAGRGGFEPVSVRQLLNYTSGIPAGEGPGDSFEEQYAHRFDVVDPHTLIATAAAKGPEFRPGEKQHYLNIDYTILAVLIEKLTGTSYEQALSDRVLRPLGLRDTSIPARTQNRIPGPHHHGYQAVARPGGGTSLVDVTDWNSSSNWAAGDLISTTADLEKFTVALFSGKVVPKAQLEEMFTVPEVADFESGEEAVHTAGMKRFVLPDGTVAYGKTGSRYGYSTVIGGTRDLSRTLVYSVNSTDAKGADMNKVAFAIVTAAFTRPAATPGA
ncbi:serine hydrolase domain-containing protein [Streptomyces sp. NBC_01565]|uniref:serine hydrolase domain-containing protein n=1 Tax=unclassified Streptomyces TaxID=2593676 RepID=UPI002251B5C6|nr:serine hydrolase domain-containing protein [Streptomyces sp. NBC_01565]MCX4540997.1 beta-lactamase family protein [Streptomyces sp. NBC_01565]